MAINSPIIADLAKPNEYASIYLAKSKEGGDNKRAKENRDRQNKLLDQLDFKDKGLVLPSRVDEITNASSDYLVNAQDEMAVNPMGADIKIRRNKLALDRQIESAKNEYQTNAQFYLKDVNSMTPYARKLREELLSKQKNLPQRISNFPVDELGSAVKTVDQSGGVQAVGIWDVPKTSLEKEAKLHFDLFKNLPVSSTAQKGQYGNYYNVDVKTVPMNEEQRQQMQKRLGVDIPEQATFDNIAADMWINNADSKKLTAIAHRDEIVKGNEGKLLFDGNNFVPSVDQKAFQFFKEDLRSHLPVDIKIQDRAIPNAAGQAKERALIGDVTKDVRINAGVPEKGGGMAHQKLQARTEKPVAVTITPETTFDSQTGHLAKDLPAVVDFSPSDVVDVTTTSAEGKNTRDRVIIGKASYYDAADIDKAERTLRRAGNRDATPEEIKEEAERQGSNVKTRNLQIPYEINKNIYGKNAGVIDKKLGALQGESSTEIERKTKDGKTAIFNSATKKFIRYK